MIFSKTSNVCLTNVSKFSFGKSLENIKIFCSYRWSWLKKKQMTKLFMMFILCTNFPLCHIEAIKVDFLEQNKSVAEFINIPGDKWVRGLIKGHSQPPICQLWLFLTFSVGSEGNYSLFDHHLIQYSCCPLRHCPSFRV